MIESIKLFFELNWQLFVGMIIGILMLKYAISAFWFLIEHIFSSPVVAFIMVVGVFVLFNWLDT